MNANTRRVLILIIALGVIAGMALIMRPAPVNVESAAAFIGPMRVFVEEEGKTRIRERYVISSPLIGRLRRITLDPGDPVAALETPVAVIEPTSPDLLDPRAVAEAEARVRAAEAAVRRADTLNQRARVEYNFAEAELGRVGEAASRFATSVRELDEAKTSERAAFESLKAASYDQEIAHFELELARSALLFARGETPQEEAARMPLVSPIDGVVLRVFRESVAVVTAGEPLLEIGDPQDLEIVIDVLSTDGVRIEPGQRIIIDHWGGSAPLEARVRLVEPSAFTFISALGIEEQRVNVIADFVSPPTDRASLGDQYYLEAKIITWNQDNILQVPSGAVLKTTDNSWAVYVIENNRAQLRHIEVGQRNGSHTQIMTGIETGEHVVLHPNDKLRPNARVKRWHSL